MLWCHDFELSASLSILHPTRQTHSHRLPDMGIYGCLQSFPNIPRGWRSPASWHWPSALQHGRLSGIDLPRHKWPSCLGHTTQSEIGPARSCCKSLLCHLQHTSTSPASLDKHMELLMKTEHLVAAIQFVCVKYTKKLIYSQCNWSPPPKKCCESLKWNWPVPD